MPLHSQTSVPPSLTRHCFGLSRGATATLVQLDEEVVSLGQIPVIDCGNMSMQEQQDLSNTLPFLACGEESAVHAFGSSLLKQVSEDDKASMRRIAQDELRHARWLEQLRVALPAPSLHLATAPLAHFFRGLLTPNVALHFARVAALDEAVCQMLLPMLNKNAALHQAPTISAGLLSIVRDEARHVAVARKMASQLGVSSDQQADISDKLQQELRILLSEIQPCLLRLSASASEPTDAQDKSADEVSG